MHERAMYCPCLLSHMLAPGADAELNARSAPRAERYVVQNKMKLTKVKPASLDRLPSTRSELFGLSLDPSITCSLTRLSQQNLARKKAFLWVKGQP